MENNANTAQAPAVVNEPAQASYIAAGAKLVGMLSSKGDVDIAGILQGDVDCQGHVMLRSNMTGDVKANDLSLFNSTLTGNCVIGNMTSVGTASKVEGNVTTTDLVCSGTVKGDIIASGNVDFSASSQVRGDVKASSVTMERGSVIVGHLCIE